jgi:hypothetical protein
MRSSPATAVAEKGPAIEENLAGRFHSAASVTRFVDFTGIDGHGLQRQAAGLGNDPELLGDLVLREVQHHGLGAVFAETPGLGISSQILAIAVLDAHHHIASMLGK